jgi:hypothetical protein
VFCRADYVYSIDEPKHLAHVFVSRALHKTRKVNFDLPIDVYRVNVLKELLDAIETPYQKLRSLVADLLREVRDGHFVKPNVRAKRATTV